MDSRLVHTLIEPTVVAIVPVRTEIYTRSSRVGTTLASPATTMTTMATSAGTVMVTATATPTTTTTATDSPALHPPTDPNSPLANGRDGTPALAILTLVAVILCGTILLLAIGYFVFLRLRGKCPRCPGHEDELGKWKRGELKPITPGMVQERMRGWDLEKGLVGARGKMGRDRMQSLACLEGRVEDWELQKEKESEKEGGEEEYFQVDAKLEEPQPAYLSAARRYSADSEKTRVVVNDSGHPATYSAYLRDVVAPRDAEAKRSLQEAEEQAFTRLANAVQNPNNRDSVLQRATIKLKEMIVAREEKELEGREGQRLEQQTLEQQMPPPRKGDQSRFVERFSLATNYDL